MRTITFPFRKVWAGFPAVALVGLSIVMSEPAAPMAASPLGLVSSNRPAIVVPDVAMTVPGSAGTVVDNFHVPASVASISGAVVPPAVPANAPANPVALNALSAITVADSPAGSNPLAPALQPGPAPGSSSPVTLDATGIPVRALEGYRKAASLTASADPGCHIDWALIAAIGRVESNHARFGGNQLDASGVARPGIIGMVLDGSNGTARITDTDNGALDRDTAFDRAVGPMQFIPSTWRFAGVDANGDGVKNPENIADASAATAVYLCSGPGDLRRPADLHSAIWRYNASDSYVAMVTSIANAYRHGVRALPASDLAPARSTSSTVGAGAASRPLARAVTSTARKPVVAQLVSAHTTAIGQQPAIAPRASSTSPGTASAVPARAANPPATRTPTQPTATAPRVTPPPTIPPRVTPPPTTPPRVTPPPTTPPRVTPPPTTPPRVTPPPTTTRPTTTPPTTTPPTTPRPTTTPPTTTPPTTAPPTTATPTTPPPTTRRSHHQGRG